jgi:hypothetical protein
MAHSSKCDQAPEGVVVSGRPGGRTLCDARSIIEDHAEAILITATEHEMGTRQGELPTGTNP